MNLFFVRGIILIAQMGIVAMVFGASASADERVDVQVPDINVYGVAPKDSVLDFVPTVSELSGMRLERKKKSTIGETLANETGVTSSQFGPNASRPIIRGMDGDRIRVLQNGTGVLDASAASPDHAVAADPLITERVEIIRGPAALLYGSNAVGGVVNMVTTRIPQKVPEKSMGKIGSRFSSTDLGRSGGIGFESGLGRHWAFHVDGSLRGADDYHVPGYARTAEVRANHPLTPEEKKRVYNSFNRSDSGALGGSYIFNDGFVGSSFSNYNSVYGTVAEREVTIEMLQQRWDLSGEVKDLGFIKSVRFKNSYSHYQHDEMEGAELGTRFKNDGNEARLDMRHQSLGGFTGIFGLQLNTFDFSAKGDEAFLPSTQNQTYSAFVYEEREFGNFKPSLGARWDSTQVKSKDDPNFGSGQTKSFDGASFSLGFLYQLNAANAFVANSSYTERAPNYQELFANGRHVATAQNEVGNARLKKEQSQSVELSWRHKGQKTQGHVGLFLQDFHDFIALMPTGVSDGDPEEPFEIFNYQAVDARLYGIEMEYRHKLPSLLPGGMLELEFKADMVRGVIRDSGDHSGEDLPRMTPIRESIAVIYKTNHYQADVEVKRSERQTQTAPNETATKAYTMVNIGMEMPLSLEFADFSVFGRINNIFDVEARNHVSMLKDIAPLPGRNFIVGAQATF